MPIYKKDLFFSNTVFSELHWIFGHEGKGGGESEQGQYPLPFLQLPDSSVLVLVFLLHNRKCPILHTFDQAVFKVRRRVGGQGGEKGFLQLLFCL